MALFLLGLIFGFLLGLYTGSLKVRKQVNDFAKNLMTKKKKKPDEEEETQS